MEPVLTLRPVGLALPNVSHSAALRSALLLLSASLGVLLWLLPLL